MGKNIKIENSIIFEEDNHDGDIVDTVILSHPGFYCSFFKIFYPRLRVISNERRSHHSGYIFMANKLPKSIRSDH